MKHIGEVGHCNIDPAYLPSCRLSLPYPAPVTTSR